MGGMRVKTNKHIEAWAHFRENINEQFRFNARTNFKIFVTVFLIPGLIYKGILVDMKHNAEVNGLFEKYGFRNKFLFADYSHINPLKDQQQSAAAAVSASAATED
eukprot:CAMPEP_0185829822 /NCGR_PEP_ID=MMETSP1353-20130828/471_1 /TAXON_ID=1077150 /ORGANISM="Erythrolobus australicus, Strain CCMP3124" /LENGTH=104 /DNA_ID=CAMNT_0028527653 /DNA_START=27 /DNA_END=341 /DNA_ORIENTATION=+